MPGRNIYKDYFCDSFYHAYNRGVNKEPLFYDDRDYSVFLNLLKRYLSPISDKKGNGVKYLCLSGRVELLSFCLMPNHFHLFIYQHDAAAMRLLLTHVSIAYSMYFNKRYKRIGPIFQQRYRAIRITDDSHLLHISRYIHLNPSNYKLWKWSSLPYYLNSLRSEWVRPDRILGMFNGDYRQFVEEYQDDCIILSSLSGELDLA